MYDWRKMTPEQREDALKLRKTKQYPWHGPPHRIIMNTLYHLSAACYEHHPFIGTSFKRMADFETDILDALKECTKRVPAWCVLPNHYHLLVDPDHIPDVIRKLGQLHGRTSFFWNSEDKQRGRKCWHRCTDRAIRSERHGWVTLNYIHHNPVRHGYVKRWQDWPFSSAARYLEEVGYDTALKRWKDYPLLDYGKGWDDPDL